MTKKFKQLFQCVYVANFCSGQKFGSLTTTGNILWPDLVRLQLLCTPLEDVVHNLMRYQMKERYFLNSFIETTFKCWPFSIHSLASFRGVHSNTQTKDASWSLIIYLNKVLFQAVSKFNEVFKLQRCIDDSITWRFFEDLKPIVWPNITCFKITVTFLTRYPAIQYC